MSAAADAPAARPLLSVLVRAGDLRGLTLPLLVGQHEQDPIAGPQALIDQKLGGALSDRHRLGLYAGPVGTATVVLRGGQSDSEPLHGAVVTGLGPYDGTLGSRSLTEAVRTGALRLLLQVRDQLGPGPRAFTLGTLLLGSNSAANLGLETVVEALVLGVLQASQRFAEVAGPAVRIERLELVELHRDLAQAAAQQLARLAPRLQALAELGGLGLVCQSTLQPTRGPRARGARSSSVPAGTSGGYWPRLLVRSRTDGALDYLHLGARARAEAIGQPLQPGLLDALLRPADTAGAPGWDAELGRTLFHLLVPPDFRETVRQLSRAVLVVDAHSAAVPWELLLADDPALGLAEPLALRMPLVRQLASSGFRRQVRRSPGQAALIIGNPSTLTRSGQGTGDRLEPLPEAAEEAAQIHQLLQDCGHASALLVGAQASASRVLRQLHARPLHLLHVSAHGLQPDGPDGRCGVMLSDDLMLTAIEIGAMDPVPELVFLNCCHLGRLDDGRTTPAQRAASLAQTLIDIGVRCVLVAGWAVSDAGAAQFGGTFYRELLQNGCAFGEAVFRARQRTHELAPAGDLSWGAFQAYGDPAWTAVRPTRPAASTRIRSAPAAARPRR
ncbi:hypothetical protein X805_13020 [Sphaerotilus natans subsp. natans DSM 6575]|uniref:CHAT domain-containing protein n=1 Tax=Sphaerotilus natans subsp. natans DSM 6575 TaxID=1286631 RepID=A0A059KP52_9BURK|nr:CHAT domain-containing protein [Sphaerotilus natans]KDB53130.1 hypothetical protein X805_13020 [Sphaerotilus natans subsp. natans DSM 6575]SIQ90019.1 CHAT domain-containing protein [Sphaerotilus natans]